MPPLNIPSFHKVGPTELTIARKDPNKPKASFENLFNDEMDEVAALIQNDLANEVQRFNNTASDALDALSRQIQDYVPETMRRSDYTHGDWSDVKLESGRSFIDELNMEAKCRASWPPNAHRVRGNQEYYRWHSVEEPCVHKYEMGEELTISPVTVHTVKLDTYAACVMVDERDKQMMQEVIAHLAAQLERDMWSLASDYEHFAMSEPEVQVDYRPDMLAHQLKMSVRAGGI